MSALGFDGQIIQSSPPEPQQSWGGVTSKPTVIPDAQRHLLYQSYIFRLAQAVITVNDPPPGDARALLRANLAISTATLEEVKEAEALATTLSQ